MLLNAGDPDGSARVDRFPAILLTGILCLVGLAPLIVALHTNINWDEFKFLSNVYEYQRGTLSSVLQTGYVYLFGWLPHVGRNEVDQIIAARVIYYAILLVSAYCLYRIARHFVSPTATLVVLISFFSFSSVFTYGTSFRADGLILCLYLLSLTLLIVGSRSPGRVLVAGALFGFGIFISIKTVLVGFALLPILLLLRSDSGAEQANGLRQLVAFGCGVILVGGMFYVFHRLSLSNSTNGAAQVLAAGDKTLLAGFLPQPGWLIAMLWRNPTTWSMLMAGLGIITLRIVSDRNRLQSVRMLCLTLPLVSIFFYRNSFPYFYALIVPSALLLVGVTYDALRGAVQRWHAMVLIMPLLLVVDALPTFDAQSQDTLTRQRVIVEAVHDIFPEPVPYVDGVSMIASYPKVGFFMSSWGLENYHARERPVFRDLVRSRTPAFLLANASDLEVFDHVYRSEIVANSRLLEADRRFLRGQFIHHWGPIYVPGTELELAAGETRTWETAVPGFYTVESDTRLVIDGQVKEPGSFVYLDLGKHRISSTPTSGTTASLRWGKDLYRPRHPPPETPIFSGF